MNPSGLSEEQQHEKALELSEGGCTRGKKASELSEEERTPKKLKFMEPDMKVVVGEGEEAVEFYHYKVILADACPFIENMLSSNMEEARDGIVRFPDKNPDEWLVVYDFLVSKTSTVNMDEKFDSILYSQISNIADTICSLGANLLHWFNYLGMETLLQRYDKIAADYLGKTYIKNQLFAPYEEYCKFKLICPNMKAMMEDSVHTWVFTFGPERLLDDMLDVKNYLLDEDCGDDRWDLFQGNVGFPDRMFQELDRKTIVNSPLFEYFLEYSAENQ